MTFVATSSDWGCWPGCCWWCGGDPLGRSLLRATITRALGRLLTNFTSRGRGGGGCSLSSAGLTVLTRWATAISSSLRDGSTFIPELQRARTFSSTEPGPDSDRPKILTESFRPCCSSSYVVIFSWAISLVSSLIWCPSQLIFFLICW